MLSGLQLWNFKSFGAPSGAVAEFGPLTLVLGANASGKSNLGDALRLLHGVGLGFSMPEILGGKFGPGGIPMWPGIRGGAHEVVTHGEHEFMVACDVLVAVDRTLVYRLQVDVSDDDFGPRVVREAVIEAQLDLPEGDSLPPGRLIGKAGEPKAIWSTHPDNNSVKTRGRHEVAVQHRLEGHGEWDRRRTRLASSKPALTQLMTRRSRRFPHSTAVSWTVGHHLAHMRFFDIEPRAAREPSPPGTTVLGDRGEHLSSVLMNLCREPARKEIVLSWIRVLTPMDAIDLTFEHDFSGRVLLHLVESSGETVSAYSASDGTLRFLALLSALLTAKDELIYIEELDTGIHPTRLHLLLDLIQSASEEHNLQVVATTHNPALLTYVSSEVLSDALLVYRTEDDSHSRIRRIADLPEIARLLQTRDLGRLLASGWLEDAAALSEPDEEEGSPWPSE